ncbi:cytochrome P450, partial [Lentinula raphanica]
MNNSKELFLPVAFCLILVLLLRRLMRQQNIKTSTAIGNVPAPRSSSWLKAAEIRALGNYQDIYNPTAWNFHEYLAKECEPVTSEIYTRMVRLHGPFGTDNLYTFDPRAMHHVLYSDHNVFDASDGFIEQFRRAQFPTRASRLNFGRGLFGTPGHEHRRQRKILNPVFSVAHLREMFPTFLEITHKLGHTLKGQLQSNNTQTQEVDIISWMGRTALEIIGQAGLGYSFDSLTDESNAHPYSHIIKELVPTLMRVQFWRMNVLPRVVWIGSPSFRRFIVNMLPWNDVHHIRDMIDYMWEVSDGIYENKKRAFRMGDEVVAQQIGKGKDIIMRENMKASDEAKLEDHEVIAQMSSLIFAAMDTTSSAMARLLGLLANNLHVQERLRDELLEAKEKLNGEDLSFDDLNGLPYLDAICKETLRLFPPVSTVSRVARQDTALPLQKPVVGLDGTKMHEVMVPKGTTVFISVLNANRNSELWGEDSTQWNPDRWLSPLLPEVAKARIPGIYSHLMTFIGGGRSCIGFKFAEMEMSIVDERIRPTVDWDGSALSKRGMTVDEN